MIPKKEARLTAAACALVHCADGVARDEPSYPILKAMQDTGNSMTEEKALLAKQQGLQGRIYGQLFQYTGVDQYVVDPFTQNKMGPRLAGATQATLGTMGVAGSAALCTTGIGCAAAAVSGTVSADYAGAGLQQAISGNATITTGEKVLQSLGLSPQAAAYTYAALGIAPAAVEAVIAGKATNATSASNAAARASYEDISKFGAKGIEVTPEVMQTTTAQVLVKEYVTIGTSEAVATRRVRDLIQTGSTLPTQVTVGPGVELIKIVPKSSAGGDLFSLYSPFFVTRKEFDALSRLPVDEIAQRLALPAEQGVRGSQLGFDVYAITPKAGSTPRVFVSEIAPIEQGAYSASGGAQQVLVPNRSSWNVPVKIGVIKGLQ